MELVVERKNAGTLSTTGELRIDDAFECYTLEPPMQAAAGPVAILARRYRLKLLPSQRFQRIMPHVMDVPDADGEVRRDRGILLHWGNVPKDTEDCCLVGQTLSPDFVGKSRIAFTALFNKLQAADERGEAMWITYRDAQQMNL